MENIVPALNFVLILTIVALGTIATRTWVTPNYPHRVDVDRVAYAPKTLEPQIINRRVNNTRIINSAVQRNLFRQDRREYSPPIQVAQVIRKPALPALPPPNLKLKGVLLLGTKKIAIMEGDYPVREGNQAIKKKTLKKKGYPLGAKIGDYKLIEIEKTNVTLSNNRGVELNLNLSDRPQDKVIRKVGNRLVQKSKGFDPGKIKKASAPPAALKRPARNPKLVRAPRAFRISGAPTNIPGGIAKPHVSGK